MGAPLLPGPDPMTEPTPPPRRPLATFLRARPADTPAADPPAQTLTSAAEASVDAQALPAQHTVPPVTEGKDWTQSVSVFEPPPAERVEHVEHIEHTAHAERDAAPREDARVATTAEAPASRLDVDTAHASAAQHDDPSVAPAEATTTVPARATPAPSFMRLPVAPLRTPRWQWGVLAGLVVLLLLQIAVADRARLAADAGTRPWIAGVCSVLRCTLPAWQEPAAFSMISRDVRPVPGQPGALQVQASFRNDARWAQAWPSLRLSLSDADGRVIGTGAFAPRDYLDRSVDATSVLEPGQSAQIAFRVREPAASTVAFTFEFL
jgi:hypothetical protein